MYKRALLIAALVAISTVGAGAANAADVSSWSELNTAENIKFAGDIQASGEPQTISINSQNNSQTIDGGQYSLTGASGYRILIDNRSELIIKNLGNLLMAQLKIIHFLIRMPVVTLFIKLYPALSTDLISLRFKHIAQYYQNLQCPMLYIQIMTVVC